MRSNFDKHDIEALLLSAPIGELGEEELAFLMQELGDRAQIIAYRDLLLRTRQLMDARGESKLKPRPAIRMQIHAKMKARTPHKGGFDALIASLLALLPIKGTSTRVALGAVLLFLFAISGTRYDVSMVRGSQLLSDSLKYQLDSPSYDVVADSSEQVIPTDRNMETSSMWKWLQGHQPKLEVGETRLYTHDFRAVRWKNCG